MASTSEDGFFFSGEGLASLSDDLLGAAAALRREAPATLVSVGKHIEDNARTIAEGHGSTSIPDSITGGLRGPLEYRIQAGGDDVPLAGLWEFGNTNARDPNFFRHPVFGTDTWVEQPRYPFMRPALNQDRAAITAEMEAMWDRVLTPYRLRPDSSALGAADVSSLMGDL